MRSIRPFQLAMQSGEPASASSAERFASRRTFAELAASTAVLAAYSSLVPA